MFLQTSVLHQPDKLRIYLPCVVEIVVVVFDVMGIDAVVTLVVVVEVAETMLTDVVADKIAFCVVKQ